MKIAISLAVAALALGGNAFAQEAAAPAAPAAPPAASPAPASADISDEQVERFALAALMVEQIAADTTLDAQQKQTNMITAVQQSGMEPQEFNAIAVASQGDTQLQERISAAAAAHIEAAQGEAAPEDNP